MRLISTLKRTGYAGVATALILAAIPVFPSSKAWAEPATCDGVSDSTEFADAITAGESEITLCADVAWTGEISSDLELNLNNKVLSTDRIQLASGEVTISDGSIIGTDAGKATLINNGATLVLNKVNITSAGEKAALRADGGSSEINSGTIYSAGNALNGRNARIVINNVTITGGELLNDIVIYGGVYKMDPTAFVADDYDAYELTDPYNTTYWRVAEEAEITPVDPVVLPVGVEGDFVTVTPAEYNILSFDNYGEAVITMDSANGKATISNDNAVEETITITNNSGKSVETTARFYGIGNISDVVLAAGSDSELDIEITKEWDGDIDWNIVDYDDTIISVGDDGKTITGLASGSTTVTVEFDDSVATTREFTVYVYDLDTDAETIMLQAGGESAVIVSDSSWEATTATSGSNILTVTPNENTFEVSASNNGTATITLTISPDGDTEITKTITVYAYKVAEITPVFVEKGNESGYLNIRVSKPNVISYTISTEDSSVATVRSAQFGRNHRARGVDVGKTAILATFSMDGVESQTVKIGEVTVYDFNNNIANNYDIASGDEFTFTAEEANANGQISVETDTDKLTISQDGGVFTVKAADDIEAGSYRVTVTDTITDEEAGTEKVVETVTFNVRVHEITVSGDAERYISLDNASVLGESFNVTVREKNNYSRTRDIRATVSGTPTGGVNVNRVNNGNFRITVSKAGSYAVTFSDSVASTTIYIYALNLNLEQTTYHVKAGDTAIKFINAMNEYWHSVNVNASLIDTEFISSTNENILVGFTQNAEEGQKYLLAIGNVEAGDYKLVFRAYANGNKTTYSEKSVTVRVYEMVAPEETSYYAYTGDQLNIEVTDKNSHAYTRVVVEEGNADGLRFNRRTNGNLRNFNVTARRAGVYKVRYTDYMENGEVVDEFVATIIVVEVEELNNVIVRKGNTLEFTGNDAWDASIAYNTTTGDELTVSENDEGEMAAVFNSAELEPGKYTVEVSHEFDDGVSMVVKRANIIVYEILTDSENDPEGVIADTIEQYLNSLVENGKIDELLETSDIPFVGPFIDLARIATLLTDDTTTSTLGNGFEGLSGLLGLHDTLNDGTSISTRVNVRPFDEEDEVDEELSEFIATLGYNVEDLMFFDVTVVMSDGTDDFGVLHELTKEITFVLCEVSEPQEGYTREWVVIRQHNGVSEVLPATKFFIKDGKLYVSSSEFSTYAVTFEDTKIPEAPDTGTYTAESKSHVDAAGILATAMMMALVGVALKDALAKRYSNKN